MSAPFTLGDLALFDSQRFIRSAEAGQKQRTLAELGQYAAAGDFKGAERAAWAGGQPDYAVAIGKYSQEQQEQLIEDTARFALGTESEAAWEAARPQWQQRGFELPPFSGRQALISQAVPVADQLRMQREDAERQRSTSAAAAAAAREPPDLAEFYDEATGQPYKAAWNPQTRSYERVGGVKAPSGMTVTTNPDGTMTMTQGAGMRPLTEGQSKDAGFATRAAGALPIIDQFDEALTSLPQTFAGSAPVIGNYFKSEEFQQAEQAGTEFLLTILRKDSGAAVPDNERREYGAVFLPRPGDSPAVIRQKRASRYRALQGLIAGMPPAAILAAEKAIGTSMPAPPSPGMPQMGAPQPPPQAMPGAPGTGQPGQLLPNGGQLPAPGGGQQPQRLRFNLETGDFQ